MRKRVFRAMLLHNGTHLLAHRGGTNRRKDKLAYDGPQWLRRYEQRYSRS